MLVIRGNARSFPTSTYPYFHLHPPSPSPSHPTIQPSQANAQSSPTLSNSTPHPSHISPPTPYLSPTSLLPISPSSYHTTLHPPHHHTSTAPTTPPARETTTHTHHSHAAVSSHLIARGVISTAGRAAGDANVQYEADGYRDHSPKPMHCGGKAPNPHGNN